MLRIFRKYQQPIMVMIVVFTIVAFIWFYNRTNFDSSLFNKSVVIHGKKIDQININKLVSEYSLSLAFGFTHFIKDLRADSNNEERNINNFVIHLSVIRYVANSLGIYPPDSAVIQKIKSMSMFQTNNIFDVHKYMTFLNQQLAPRGYTERDLELMLKDTWIVEKIKNIVTSPIAITDEMVAKAIQIHQVVVAEFITFKLDPLMKNTSVSREEIRSFYANNQTMMQMPEERSLAYLKLTLDPKVKALNNKEQLIALETVAKKSLQISEQLKKGCSTQEIFESTAKKLGLQVEYIKHIDQNGRIAGKEVLSLPPLVRNEIFRLKNSGDISHPIQDESNFYIIRLQEIFPMHHLTLDNVSSSIQLFLKEQKAIQGTLEQANMICKKIRKSMRTNSFDKALKEESLSSKILPEIAADTNPQMIDPKTRYLINIASSLRENELSNPLVTPWEIVAVYLKKRELLPETDLKKYAKEMKQKILETNSQLLFQEWLQSETKKANIHIN